MSHIYYFTSKQKEVEGWITDLGFRVRKEVDFDQFRVDLYLSELSMAVEIDGPQHRKVKATGEWVTEASNRKASKRDKKFKKIASRIS